MQGIFYSILTIPKPLLELLLIVQKNKYVLEMLEYIILFPNYWVMLNLIQLSCRVVNTREQEKDYEKEYEAILLNFMIMCK